MLVFIGEVNMCTSRGFKDNAVDAVGSFPFYMELGTDYLRSHLNGLMIVTLERYDDIFPLTFVIKMFSVHL